MSQEVKFLTMGFVFTTHPMSRVPRVGAGCWHLCSWKSLEALKSLGLGKELMVHAHHGLSKPWRHMAECTEVCSELLSVLGVCGCGVCRGCDSWSLYSVLLQEGGSLISFLACFYWLLCFLEAVTFKNGKTDPHSLSCRDVRNTIYLTPKILAHA